MNLLLVIPYAPSPIRTRSFHIVRALAQRGHAVTLAAPWEGDDDRARLDQLRREGIDVLTAPLSRVQKVGNVVAAAVGELPLQAAYSWSGELFGKIRARLESDGRIDAIHVEHLRGARYAMALRAASDARPDRPGIVWDSVDCISLLFERTVRFSPSARRRTVARLELPRTRRCEGRLARQAAHVLATSAEDARALEDLGRRTGGATAPMTVVPNGVDLSYFSPNGIQREAEELLLTGKMSYHANEAAALHLVQDIMPLVWSSRPSVRVVVAGKSPGRAVRDLERIRPGFVTVTGTVAELRPYLRRAAVAVAPLVYSVGVQNKILEAMACATPVIASPTATAALDARPGEEILVAGTPPSFAQAILRVLADDTLRHRLGEGGRRYVKSRHDWGAIVGDLEQIYAEVASDRRRPPARS